MWLDETRSLYDAFGFEWTLLSMGQDAQAQPFVEAARQRGVDLKVVHLPAAHELYEADFALIRPDQIVAWRGNRCDQAAHLFETLLAIKP